jgi:putative transposase
MLNSVKELAQQIGSRAACEALGFPRATWQRLKNPGIKKDRKERLGSHPLILDPASRARFLEVAGSPEYVDKAPPQIFFSLLDRCSIYICSIRTMYRILAQEAQLRERRDQLRHPVYQRPELLATGARQLWSWDITKLRGPQKGNYFMLYVVIDVFSRYVVGWLLATQESDGLAQQLLEGCYHREGVRPGQLTIHADRGSAMTSLGVAGLLERLDVRKSHSRPGVSDDNPYSESQFRTMKYCPEYPDRFGSIEDAREFCRAFFAWYNEQNYHSGICWLTPACVHRGQAEEILAKRHATLTAVYENDPLRFRNRPPKLYVLPDKVWINRPFSTSSGS